MKRTALALACAAVLAACASPFARAETPDQALAATAQQMSQLKSARFDLTGAVSIQFPPELLQNLGVPSGQGVPPGLSLGNLAISVQGHGEAQFPDRFHAAISSQMGGISVNTEEVVVGDKVYVKNPVTGKWTSVQAPAGVNAFSQPDPLSYTQMLDAVQSVKDLGDTTLDGVTVHHYQVIPDKAKLEARLNTSPAFKNPQAQAAIREILDTGTLTAEVFFGKDDHLVRRLVWDANVSLDLNKLMSSLGAGSTLPPKAGLPAGSTVRMTVHFLMNYHDFNAPVTVQVPTVGA